MGLLFLFIDGLGLGEKSYHNPLSNRDFQGFQQLTLQKRWTADQISSSYVSKGLVFSAIDACLQTEGLPQSGTGQATLFSGINASDMLGRHFGPYPHSKIKPLLQENSLFHQVLSLNRKPHFINGFPEIFFERSEKSNRWSCATLMTRSSGLSINGEYQVRQAEAITAEILQDYWHRMLSLDIPEISYSDAADRVARALNKYDVILMEYYLTDKAGHSMNYDQALQALERIDAFLLALLPRLGSTFLSRNAQSFNELKTDFGNHTNHTIVITSDHGNIEDLSVKTHTFNPVPLVAWGDKAHYFQGVTDLSGVTPAIIRSFQT
jgi:2,3-bisphosphoglycerate-independent phosphoglycerate mutase